MTIPTVQHTPACQAAQAAYQAATTAYETAYPNWCRACDGAGETCYDYDPSPAGVSLGAGHLTDCDPCASCVEQGRCPRCGRGSFPDPDASGNPQICGNCGFVELSTDGHPTQPDCDCWERTIPAAGYPDPEIDR